MFALLLVAVLLLDPDALLLGHTELLLLLRLYWLTISLDLTVLCLLESMTDTLALLLFVEITAFSDSPILCTGIGSVPLSLLHYRIYRGRILWLLSGADIHSTLLSLFSVVLALLLRSS